MAYMRSRRLGWLELGFLLGSAACGQLVDDDYQGDPSATIRGKITNLEEIQSPATVGVSVIWGVPFPGPDFDEGTYVTQAAVSQSVSVEADFPAPFILEIAEPPPAETLSIASLPFGTPEGTTMANGVLVVYADHNQNGVLDLLGAGAQDPIDELLGWNRDLVLYYIEGGPVTFGPTVLGAGFNLASEGGGYPEVVDPQEEIVIPLDDNLPAAMLCGERTFDYVRDDLDLALRDDSHLYRWDPVQGVEVDFGAYSFQGEVLVAGPLQIPATVVQCREGLVYVYYNTFENLEICHERITFGDLVITNQCRDACAGIPWPCP